MSQGINIPTAKSINRHKKVGMARGAVVHWNQGNKTALKF